MRERLTVFRKNRAVWPDHILFYRDGVSESQYGMVKARELPQIRDAIREIQRMSPDGRNCKPKVTLLIVGKRHHMRFYPEAPEDQKSLGPGNVVDTGVVIPHAFNFYLQSHDSLLGTTRAAHYVVLVDESGYGGAELQAVVSLNLRLALFINDGHKLTMSQRVDSRSLFFRVKSYACPLGLYTRSICRPLV